MKNLASYIDHTLLKPDCTELQVVALCNEAREYQFASVCVLPTYVALCANELEGSEVAVCTVVGFPLGANMTSVKVAEAIAALDAGASEIDMVANITAIKSGHLNLVFADIQQVTQAVHQRGGIVKVIIETCLLTDAEKIKLCHIVSQCGANFIKTSTGFSTGGATQHDVQLMHANVTAGVLVKASGSIRDYQTAQLMIAAGASRLGTSSGIVIVQGASPAAGTTGY
ncbi:MAG: deoxyribose-phosphate aldolase [Ignavibacteria bacterium]|nr:deoxyribose-phosphate aldolase [Ignavibacteria bacterium]